MAATTHITHPSDEILNSWKEISAHLGRGVRTAQRWERDLGLPVRRPRGKHRSAVIAFRKELDLWLAHCPLTMREQSVNGETLKTAQVRTVLRQSLQAGSALRQELRRQCEQTTEIMSSLMTSLRLLQQTCGTKENKVCQESA